jgi:enoyl-CoA hydratase/carnithine racemase
MSIVSTVASGVATIEIARPEKKNAITQAMYLDLAAALRTANSADDVRAVLLKGQPGIFCAGNDLEDFLLRMQPGRDAPPFQFMQAMLDCDKPIVAAVEGPAVGIGATLLLHCDLVYLSDTAALSMPFVQLGLVPEFASSFVLPRVMGNARANAKLLLGEPISATEAVACGIANAALPSAEVLPHATQIAQRLATLPAGAVRGTKQLLRHSDRGPLQAAIGAEAELFIARLSSDEARQAMQAFLNKRKSP